MIDNEDYLHFTSRESEIINYKGYKFSPRDVENVLEKSPHVSEACVVLKEGLESFIIALIKSNKRDEEVTKQLKDSCRNYLESYKIPKKIIYVDAIEKSDTGKMQRRFMREKYAK